MNEELNRRISELKGWKIVQARRTWFEVFRPDGEFVYGAADEALCVTRISLSPNWTGDAAANEELLEEMPHAMVYKSTNGEWRCRSNHQKADWAMLAKDPDRKTAVALAWLKWKGADQ